MPTARQIDELEETLRTFHNTNHAASGLSLECCDDLKCLEARLSIAWLRASIRDQEAEKERHRKSA